MVCSSLWGIPTARSLGTGTGSPSSTLATRNITSASWATVSAGEPCKGLVTSARVSPEPNYQYEVADVGGGVWWQPGGRRSLKVAGLRGVRRVSLRVFWKCRSRNIRRCKCSGSAWASRARYFFFFSSRRRHTRLQGDWSSDVCSSDLNYASIDSVRITDAANNENRTLNVLFSLFAASVILTLSIEA